MYIFFSESTDEIVFLTEYLKVENIDCCRNEAGMPGIWEGNEDAEIEKVETYECWITAVSEDAVSDE